MLLASITVAGTIGYVLIEGWSVGDALYMTVITMSTVGFQEVRPLSTAGRDFTILLIVAGVASFTYLVGSLSQYVASGVLTGAFRSRRMQHAIEHLSGHYIVCGYGRVGKQVAHDLQRRRQRCVIVERDPALLDDIATEPLHVVGDASDDDALRRAGIVRARGLVAATGDEATNLFVTMSARALNADAIIVARANQPATEAKLVRAGATHVVSPYAIGGHRIATQLLYPGITDFLDIVMHSGQQELWLEEIIVAPGSTIEGQTVGDALPRSPTGVNLIAVRRGARGAFITNPPPELRFASGDVLIALGTREQLQRLGDLTAGRPVGGDV
jgi:voltage-gated potassium channel